METLTVMVTGWEHGIGEQSGRRSADLRLQRLAFEEEGGREVVHPRVAEERHLGVLDRVPPDPAADGRRVLKQLRVRSHQLAPQLRCGLLANTAQEKGHPSPVEFVASALALCLRRLAHTFAPGGEMESIPPRVGLEIARDGIAANLIRIKSN